MATLNDLKRTKLAAAGFTGALPEAELAYLQSLGATANQINDAWFELASVPPSLMYVFQTDGTPLTISPVFQYSAASGLATMNARLVTVPVNTSLFRSQAAGAFYDLRVDASGNYEAEATGALGNFTVTSTTAPELDTQADFSFTGTGFVVDATTVISYTGLDLSAAAATSQELFNGIDAQIATLTMQADFFTVETFDFRIVSTTVPTVTSITGSAGSTIATTAGSWVVMPASNGLLLVPEGNQLNELKAAYFLANGGIGNSYNDIEYSFWDNL